VTAAEKERLLEMVRHPRPGSRVAAAKEFGIDLTLTIENLQLSPSERLLALQAFAGFLEELGRTAHDVGA
jgi:hypothetical protein